MGSIDYIFGKYYLYGKYRLYMVSVWEVLAIYLGSMICM